MNDSNTDIGVVMTSGINMSESTGKLFEALSKAQAVIEGAKEDSDNPFFKSKYADLTSVWQACRKPLTDNGLTVVQTMDLVADRIFLVTTLGHISGQWICSYLPIPITKPDPQTLGSAITYCRRYALSAIVGICPADDDAEGAMKPFRKGNDDDLLKEFLSQFDKEESMQWSTYIAEIRKKYSMSVKNIVDKYHADPQGATEKLKGWLSKKS